MKQPNFFSRCSTCKGLVPQGDLFCSHHCEEEYAIRFLPQKDETEDETFALYGLSPIFWVAVWLLLLIIAGSLQ